MPRIPTPSVSVQVPGVGTLGAPRVAPLINPAGAQIARAGRAVETTGLQIASAAHFVEETIHLTATKKAQALAEERIQDANQGYLTKVGEAATGEARDEAWEDLRDKIDRIRQGLPEQRQRELFERVMVPRLLQTRGRWGAHEVEQAVVAETGARTALLQQKVDTAIQEGPAPEGARHPTAHGLLRAVRMEARQLAVVRGLGTDTPQSQEFVKGWASQVHVGIVNNLLRQHRVSNARSYLAGVQSRDMSEATRTQLQRSIDTGKVGEDGFRLAVEITAGLEGDAEGPLKAVDQLNRGLAEIQRQQAEDGLPFEVAEAARQQLKRMANERNGREIQSRSDDILHAEQYLLQGRAQGLDMATYQQDHPDRWNRLFQHGVVDDLNRFANNDGNYDSNRAIWQQLQDPTSALYRLNPQQFRSALSTKLDRVDFARAVAMYNQIKGIEDPEFDIQIDQRELERAYDIAGLVDKDDVEDRERRYNLYRDILRRLTEEQATQGRKLHDAEKATIAQNAARDVRTIQTPGFFGTGTVGTRARGAFTEEEELQLADDIAATPDVPRSFITYETMQQAWRRENPGVAVPPELQQDGQVAVRAIPTSENPEEDMHTYLIARRRRKGLPATDVHAMMDWIQLGRPPTLAAAYEAGRHYRNRLRAERGEVPALTPGEQAFRDAVLEGFQLNLQPFTEEEIRREARRR